MNIVEVPIIIRPFDKLTSLFYDESPRGSSEVLPPVALEVALVRLRYQAKSDPSLLLQVGKAMSLPEYVVPVVKIFSLFRQAVLEADRTERLVLLAIGTSIRKWDHFQLLPETAAATMKKTHRLCMSRWQRIWDRISDFVRVAFIYLFTCRYRVADEDKEKLINTWLEYSDMIISHLFHITTGAALPTATRQQLSDALQRRHEYEDIIGLLKELCDGSSSDGEILNTQTRRSVAADCYKISMKLKDLKADPSSRDFRKIQIEMLKKMQDAEKYFTPRSNDLFDCLSFLIPLGFYLLT